MPEFEWTSFQDQIKHALGGKAYDNWLSSLTLKSYDDGALVIAAPDKVTQQWIRTHYLDQLQKIANRVDENIEKIDINIAKTVKTKPTERSVPHPDSPHIHSQSSQNIVHNAVSQSPLNPNLSWQHFYKDNSNELARAAAQRIIHNQDVHFNPLYIYGEIGTGKSHLLQAIALELRAQKDGRRSLFMTAEKFMYLFIRALRQKDMLAFKEAVREIDILLIDDLEFICGKPSTQNEFFQTLNALIENNKQVIIAANKPPAQIHNLDERLLSRLSSGLVVDIQAPTQNLRRQVIDSRLQNWAAQQSHQSTALIDEDVCAWLAALDINNLSHLEGHINRLLAHAELLNEKITLQKAQTYLSNITAHKSGSVNIANIKRCVAQHYCIDPDLLVGKSRRKVIAEPRQIGMYLTHQLTTLSFAEIGENFGGRDSSTVRHACTKIQQKSDNDMLLADELEKLKTRCQENG